MLRSAGVGDAAVLRRAGSWEGEAMPHEEKPGEALVDEQPRDERPRILAVRPEDWPVLRDLARTIWHQHYTAIISTEQIDFMLGERFTDESLRQQVALPGHELAVLWLGERAVGYCGSGPSGEPGVFKLGQLYVLAEIRGRGLGRRMLQHVEQRAAADGAGWLMLQVNKQNQAAIGFYQQQGFTVREAAVFDIGNGFVMDDYVMQKPVGGILPRA